MAAAAFGDLCIATMLSAHTRQLVNDIPLAMAAQAAGGIKRPYRLLLLVCGALVNRQSVVHIDQQSEHILSGTTKYYACC
jgi:hypothetical protein